ncbi:hypothetical protein I302_105826 [Kwoniella bestiolae CBS 10118]|uniref:Uncharacterized protein n=1 Tax=Kwoniella bestiolae CBS 10118 TaxID=1296100 RepID=A0A1B9G2B2_9TREE|nr:hypothetical protein I302_04948 [Kwoniella bestiolae CBS 10118]OCF25138.1 hypothetical protein I302_04948 [Kwoniella bestiolae CBS 10118]
MDVLEPIASTAQAPNSSPSVNTSSRPFGSSSSSSAYHISYTFFDAPRPLSTSTSNMAPGENFDLRPRIAFLYHDLTITGNNAEKVFRGLANTPREGRAVRVRQGKGSRSLLWMWIEYWGMRDPPPSTITYPYATVEEEDELDDQTSYPNWDTTLIIASIPSRLVSQDFKTWSRLSSVSPLEDRLLLHVRTIIVTGQAIRELAEWSDRYQKSNFEKRPFVNGLINASSPDQLCMTYPKLHLDQYPPFLNDRIGHLKNILSSSEWANKEEDLKRSFSNMTFKIDQAVISFLQLNTTSLSGWSPSDITLHNRRAGPLAFNRFYSHRSKRTRIVLEDCTLDHHSAAEPLIARFRTMDGALYNEDDIWELILPRKFMEEDEHGVLAKWERWKDEFMAKYPTFNEDRLNIIVWSEAEKCECCGHSEGF